jgi:hypothetical protein
MADMDMPTTRKELCKYINKILTDLLDEAKDNEDEYADITFIIKGDTTFIYNYIESMCSKYNEKNDVWKCFVDIDYYAPMVAEHKANMETHTGDDTEYTLKVCHVWQTLGLDDYGNRFGWILDDDDTPLCDTDA